MSRADAILTFAGALRVAQDTGRALSAAYEAAGDANGVEIMRQTGDALDTLLNASIELDRAERARTLVASLQA